MNRGLARRIVGLYPPAWRARYEAELLALVEAEPVTLRSLMDLVYSCGEEWWRSGVGHGSRLARVASLIARELAELVSKMAAAMVIVGAGAALAWLAPPEGEAPDLAWYLSKLSSMVEMALLMRLLVPGLRKGRAQFPVLRPFENRIWLAALVVDSAARQLIGADFVNVLVYPVLFVGITAWRPPVLRSRPRL